MKAQIKLVIPQVPESYNKIKDWHWAKKSDYNQLWYDEVAYNWRKFWADHLKHYVDKGDWSAAYYEYGLSFVRANICFYIYFPNKRKRDKINFAAGLKPALDGLIQVGIITDDNWDNIEDQYYKRYDKEKPRTVIVINEGKE